MKKILFSIAALIASASISAQTVQLFKGETLVKEYTQDEVDRVVFKEAQEIVNPIDESKYHYDLYLTVGKHGGMSSKNTTLVRSIDGLDAGKGVITITGIGTACHEFSHCFGLPDFYDTDGRNFGMSTWSLMDYGEYNGNGGNPVGFTSYERMFCGWLEPKELTEPVRVVGMPALTSKPAAYILRNSGKSDEYYLFENRQKVSWDKYIGGHGMLVIHVDYDSLAWAENAVNVFRNHQRMTIIPADNMLYSGTLSGDPWPQSEKTELSDNSTPAASLYNPNAEGDLLMHHSITEITESSDKLISFIFDEEALGINSMGKGQSAMDNCIYNLSGQRLTKPQKGINIINGKKYFE